MRAARLAKLAVIAALIVVLIVVLIVMFTPYRCFLDILNAAIKRQCRFQPFYAGTATTPPPRAVIPELGDLEDAFPAIRAEMEAVLKDRDRIPYMHETYDNIFLYKGSGAQGGGNVLTRAATRLVYGKDTDIFDRIGSRDWRTFNLVMFDRDVPRNAARCPTTAG